MQRDAKQFLLTTAWLFAMHGQRKRARTLCEALAEDDPRDGVSAVALAELQLADGEAENAMHTLSIARIPKDLERAEAFIETRALRALGRKAGAERRLQRYINSSKGKARTWA